MGITFLGQRICSRPAKGSGIGLSALVALLGSGPSKHSVGKYQVWKSLIAKHPVIGREASGQRRVQASPYPTLHCSLNSPFGFLWGDHPPGCQGQVVDWRGPARSYVSIQAGVHAGYVDMIQQDLMEIAVMQYVGKVSGRGV